MLAKSHIHSLIGSVFWVISRPSAGINCWCPAEPAVCSSTAHPLTFSRACFRAPVMTLQDASSFLLPNFNRHLETLSPFLVWHAVFSGLSAASNPALDSDSLSSGKTNGAPEKFHQLGSICCHYRRPLWTDPVRSMCRRVFVSVHLFVCSFSTSHCTL